MSPSGLEDLRIVLVETSHPGNIGAVARAMWTMGLTRLYLVRPKRFPCAEATARAAGADELLYEAHVCDSLAAAVDGCGWVVGTTARRRRLSAPVLAPRAWAEVAARRGREAPGALVLGRESSGLSNEELDLCHAAVAIPANPAYRSLNLAAAAQVLAYEYRQAVDATPAAIDDDDRDPPATFAEVEGLHEHLQQFAAAVGYVDPANPKLLERRLRRLLARAAPLRSEVNILRGILSAARKRDSSDGGG